MVYEILKLIEVWQSYDKTNSFIVTVLFFYRSDVYGSREIAESAGLSLAETIASKSPVAVQGSKVNLVYARDNTVDNALEYAVSQCVCGDCVVPYSR